MFRFIKKVLILVLISTANSLKCIPLKNQECEVKKVIIDNDYMTFTYKIKVKRCAGSCNNKDNPYFKVFTPDIVKNVSVKVFDLISQKNVLKNITFHESCKCDCLINEKVSNNKQKSNENKCRCECLEIKECEIRCRCDFKKAAKLITTEECDVEIDGIVQNKTITLTKRTENCKPFVPLSILFVSVSIILSGIMIYFCLKSRNKDVLPY